MINYDKYKAIVAKAQALHVRTGLAAGEAARDASVAQVGNAYQAWIGRRLAYIKSLPAGREFTTDQVWAAAPAADHKIAERRAMGAAMTLAMAEDLIRPTGEYMKSSRPACHARPVAIWVRK
jgi:hypothetical protein